MRTLEQCPAETTLEIIGGKWKTVILYQLSKGTMRFGELHRAVPLITRKMLTQQLRELEAANIVHREVFPEVPPRVEYSLTELGQSLKPVLKTLCTWGEHYERNREKIAS